MPSAPIYPSGAWSGCRASSGNCSRATTTASPMASGARSEICAGDPGRLILLRTGDCRESCGRLIPLPFELDTFAQHLQASVMADSTAILVLGMHRSGTSATAGWLKTLGVNLGPYLMAEDPTQPKGYFEHAEIV